MCISYLENVILRVWFSCIEVSSFNRVTINPNYTTIKVNLHCPKFPLASFLNRSSNPFRITDNYIAFRKIIAAVVDDHR